MQLDGSGNKENKSAGQARVIIDIAEGNIKAIEEYVLSYKNSINDRLDSQGNTLLHLAVKKGLNEVVRFINTEGEKLNLKLKNNDKQTPADICAATIKAAKEENAGLLNEDMEKKSEIREKIKGFKEILDTLQAQVIGEKSATGKVLEALNPVRYAKGAAHIVKSGINNAKAQLTNTKYEQALDKITSLLEATQLSKSDVNGKSVMSKGIQLRDSDKSLYNQAKYSQLYDKLFYLFHTLIKKEPDDKKAIDLAHEALAFINNNTPHRPVNDIKRLSQDEEGQATVFKNWPRAITELMDARLNKMDANEQEIKSQIDNILNEHKNNPNIAAQKIGDIVSDNFSFFQRNGQYYKSVIEKISEVKKPILSRTSNPGPQTKPPRP